MIPGWSVWPSLWQSDNMSLPRLTYERYCDLSLFHLLPSLILSLITCSERSQSWTVLWTAPHGEELELMASSQQGPEASVSSCISEPGNKLCSPGYLPLTAVLANSLTTTSWETLRWNSSVQVLSDPQLSEMVWNNSCLLLYAAEFGENCYAAIDDKCKDLLLT